MRSILIAALIFCAGCAPLNTVEYTSDASGRWVKTAYSKSYLSPKTDLGDGLLVTITGYDEGKVNPVASALGALGPETETPPASYVLHFKNTSVQPVSLELFTFKVRDIEYPLEPKTATIQPGEILDSNKIMGTLSLWSHDVETQISVNYKAQNIVKTIVLHHETQDELKARMKRYRESLRYQ
jgi:hypothetical protein